MTQTSDFLADNAALSQSQLMHSLYSRQSWQPQLLGLSGYTEHLHVLAWLVSVMRPRQGVGLGIDRGVAYFTLCQAASEAGLGSQFTGVDIGFPDADASEWAEALRMYNQQNHATRSQLITADQADALGFDLRGIDLLLVDQNPSAGLLNRLRSHWFPLMSAQGVIVLRGAADWPDKESDVVLQAFADTLPYLALSGGNGLWLILVGDAPSAILRQVFGLLPDSPERAAFEQQLSDLAPSLHKQVTSFETESAWLIREAAEERRHTIAKLSQRDTALANRTRALEDSLRASDALKAKLANSAHEIVVLTRIAQKLRINIVASRQDHKASLATLADRESALAAQTKQLEKSQRQRAALAARLENSAAEAAALAQKADTQAAALAARLENSAAEAAALVQKADTQVAALAEFRKDLAKIQTKLKLANTELAEKNAVILELHNSTSWKLTAPLRRIKNIVKKLWSGA